MANEMTAKNALNTSGRRRPPPMSDQSVTTGVTMTAGTAAATVSHTCQCAMLIARPDWRERNMFQIIHKFFKPVLPRCRLL